MPAAKMGMGLRTALYCQIYQNLAQWRKGRGISMLYHYTSIDGFFSILNSKSLRLTRSGFLNDPSDCKVLTTLIRDYLHSPKAPAASKNLDGAVADIYKKAPLLDYIVFLQEKIPLYVFSLTKNSDTLGLWNYYGNGGIQFELAEDGIIEDFSGLLKSENDFLALAPVKYVGPGETLGDVILPAFESYRIDSKNRSHLFVKHKNELQRLGENPQLYATTSLELFIKTYMKGYLNTLTSLYTDGTITSSSGLEEIYKAVFHNTMALNRKMLWKKDLTLYILLLSSLIKSNTYEYEDEVRVVFFNTDLTPPYSQTVNYTIQSLQGQKYIKPYIDTGKTDLASMKSIVLSPLTRNLSLDNDLHMNIVGEYASSRLDRSIEVEISKHKVRW